MGRRVIELHLEFEPLFPASPSTYGLGRCCWDIQPFDIYMIVFCKCVGLHLCDGLCIYALHYPQSYAACVLQDCLALICQPPHHGWDWWRLSWFSFLWPTRKVEWQPHKPAPAQDRGCTRTVYRAVWGASWCKPQWSIEANGSTYHRYISFYHLSIRTKYTNLPPLEQWTWSIVLSFPSSPWSQRLISQRTSPELFKSTTHNAFAEQRKGQCP